MNRDISQDRRSHDKRQLSLLSTQKSAAPTYAVWRLRCTAAYGGAPTYINDYRIQLHLEHEFKGCTFMSD